GIICDRVCPPPPPPEPLLSDVIQETVTVVLNAAQTGMINLAVAKPLEITLNHMLDEVGEKCFRAAIVDSHHFRRAVDLIGARKAIPDDLATDFAVRANTIEERTVKAATQWENLLTDVVASVTDPLAADLPDARIKSLGAPFNDVLQSSDGVCAAVML